MNCVELSTHVIINDHVLYVINCRHRTVQDTIWRLLQNTRIEELEKELKSLDDQITEIRNYSSEQASEEKRHIEMLHSHEQVLKSKVCNHIPEYISAANWSEKLFTINLRLRIFNL